MALLVDANEHCAFVLTAQTGTNADLFPNIVRLYIPVASKVVDMTWGKGVFWQKVDASRYVLTRNDLFRDADTHEDFRRTSFASASFDAAVLDPPYAAHGTPMKESIDECYKGSRLDVEMSCAGVMSLYRDGAAEARRLLKTGGVLILKVQDEIESGKQKWKHAELLAIEGFICEDLFVLVQKSVPAMRHNYQKHARKNHSYFLVHRKL